MPELPEVECGRRTAEGVAVGRTIVSAWCDDDTIVFDGVAPRRFRRQLEGRTVRAVCRRGKHLWFELDERPWPLFHFGMTGAFRVPEVEPLRLQADPEKRDLSWPPRFAKVHLTFDDGGELVFVNKRRLGRVRLRENPAAEPPISKLGFDPLLDLPSVGDFSDLVKRRSVTLKGLLLDQKFAAGVGNWIADEVLYQAKLDPRRRANELETRELKRLHGALRKIIERAVAVDAEKTRFPRGWLFHYRWGKDADATTPKGEKIEHIEVAGRTTAWVPAVQV